LDSHTGCVGCGRYNIINISNFPDDFPHEFMMCCACVQSYYYSFGIPNPPRPGGYHCSDGFCKGWWDAYGEKIEKAMTLGKGRKLLEDVINISKVFE